ncbi:hypothetical protein B7463_g11246, partial [Scytalidium lignicola]
MDFISMPKIELHAHLSGSISRQCLHEIWLKRKENGEMRLQDPLVEMPLDKFDYDLQTTNSVLKDFQADGVIYLELRTTPRAIPSANITKDDYVQTILRCISDFSASSQSTKTPMTTKLILSIDRRNDLPTAMSVVDLALKYQSQGVVGIDLCGDPAKGDVSIFAPAFQKAKANSLSITIHFAESPLSSTEKELQTLLSYEPDRIGHVINVPDDIKEEIVRRKLGLELCLSCNVHARMITGSFSDHHFGWWKGTGCPITLCTDDVGVFGSPLSNEYVLIAQHFNLGRKEICDVARSGIDKIFGGEDEKERLRKIMWT